MRTAALLLLLALAACSGEPDPGRGGLSEEEASALNEAAAATDINAGVTNSAP